MSVRIVSVPDSSNFGSFLQAFSLLKVIQSYSNNVFFEKTRDDKYIKNLFISKKTAFKIFLKDPIFGLAKIFYLKKQYSIFKSEWDKYFDIKKNIGNYDITILGSDEIWNIKNSVFRKPVFFGGDCDNAYAFAVSAGSASILDFKNNDDICNLIRSVKCVFPRDNNTKNIVDSILLIDSKKACDPTFLYDFSGIEVSLETKKAMSKYNNYLLIYAYSVDKKTSSFIKRVAKKERLKIVSIGFYHKFADLNLNCTPLDMFWVFKHSRLIFTSTFHGTVFSILANKQFVSCPTNSKAKIGSLLQDFSLQLQLIPPSTDYNFFEKSILNEIEYSSINEKIISLRRSSLKILEDILKNGAKV